jgi:hypothetical protein
LSRLVVVGATEEGRDFGASPGVDDTLRMKCARSIL